MVPTIAIQRVDVLATGASSIYGADAVAGVVNFITRKSYDGLMIQGQAGVADGYLKDGLSAIWGTHWDNGNVYMALQYSYSSSLREDARDYTANPDQTQRAIDAGLPVATSPTSTNFNNFECSPATIQMGGTGPIYTSAASGVTIVNNSKNGICNSVPYEDLLPSEMREQARVQITQGFGPLVFTSAINYSYRLDHQRRSRGGLSSTRVYATGPQANPFYTVPAGYTGNATFQVIRWNADQLLSSLGEATNNNALGGGSTSDFYMHNKLTYDLGGNYTLTYDNVLGQDRTYSNDFGVLCQSCANLALNGTTNPSGNLNTVSIPGTPQQVIQLPLTVDNALDVWNPRATNRTSPDVIKQLGYGNSIANAFVSTLQHKLVLDGPLPILELPGGPIRFALGAEYLKWTDFNEFSGPNNTGPSTQGSVARVFHFGRHIESAFLELNFPVIGPENGIAFVNSLTFDISGRHDSMSDVGHTTNPKFAVDWGIVPGLSFKANYSTAFVPPSLISVGDISQNYSANYAGVSPSTANITFQTALFPNVAGVLPGCPAGATTCQLNANTPGLTDNGGGGTAIKPAKGDDWSLGIDYTPDFWSGFNINITYFNDKVKGLINSPSNDLVFGAPALTHLVTMCPTGCTQAQINAFGTGWPLSAPLPSTVYYLADRRQANVIFFNAEGLDIGANYNFDTDMGNFDLQASVTQFITFDYAPAPGTPYISVIGTSGFTNGPTLAQFANAHITWTDPSDTFEATLFASHAAGYHNWSTSSVTPIVRDASGYPIGGRDHVESQTLFDVHFAYNFPNDTFFGGHQIYFDMKNVFDSDPSYVNGATGFSSNYSNPIGRLSSIGFRLKF
jgi:iron complex outermembrane receptor protein